MSNFKRVNLQQGLVIITWIAVIVSLYMVFIFAPTERTMGHVQRIFYYHVSAAWIGFFAFFVTFVGSVIYLWKSSRFWDIIAHASVEVGVIFTTVVVTTGPIWAKYAWNVWWTWDSRLTTTAILWVIYVAYLMLRGSLADRERAARLAAVFGIIGFIDVPIVFMAIRWWRTIHPDVLMGGGSGLARDMVITLLFCLLTFSLLYFTLLWQRVRIELTEDKIIALEMRE